VERTNPRGGQGGRPRSFQDDDFFRAVTEILVFDGFPFLTLDAVARELGCTAPAVSRRFGSKRGLIRAYLEWTLERMTGRFHAVRECYESPIEALRARGVIPAEQRSEEIGDPANPDHQAHIATFWAQMRNDPEFRPLFERYIKAAEDEIAALLAEAMEANELQRCDPEAIGRALTAAWAWTTLFWTGDGPDGSLVNCLGQVFDTIVGPYRNC
jgi:AcrR family transcriptional regulator